MPGVRVRQQHGVRQVLAQHIGISNRDHIVKNPVHDKARLSYFGELAEAIAIGLFPGAKGRHLGHCSLRAGQWLTIFLACCEPGSESLSCRLTGLAWRKKELHELFQS